MISRTRVTEELDEQAPEGKGSVPLYRRQGWHRSILGRVTLFLLIGILFSYGVGAVAGWFIVDKNSQEQWRRQADTNAHIMSYLVRSIYTSVVARMDEAGLVTGIVTENFLGDDESILQTGFNPVDVLSLIAMQTNNRVWLFHYREKEGFASITDASGNRGGDVLKLEDRELAAPDALMSTFAGFVRIEGKTYFASVLPILTPTGKLLGAVVSSIGEKHELYRIHDTLLRNSLIGLWVVLLVTGVIISLLMRQFFHSVPTLIQALTRIAHGDTANVTPLQQRNDEIGHLAFAIEKLRQAMVEREHLQQIKDTARKMEYMAHHDHLTGLPNRTFFSGALENSIAMLKSKNAHFNLMLLDLDYFKSVNDTYGHPVGDALLINVSERISLLIGNEDIVARLGGDEFALIQQVKGKPIQEARQLAEKVISAISAPFYCQGYEFCVGISIGIASAPLHGETSHSLMKNADVALYASKSAGRNNYHYFEYGMVMPSSVQDIKELDIEGAMSRKEFELYYQPLIRLSDNAIVGYEALVRWRHDARELLMPDMFITLAEKTGLIIKLGEWVIQQACADAMLHFSEHQCVSVNISGIQIHHPGLTDTLADALEKSGLPASRIELEITESILLDRRSALPVLQQIQSMGISIALDDLGTGYSSLDCLADFPFSRVKLDKGLVADLEESESKRVIVSGIISLVNQLGMECVAEGVETERQLDLLRDAGCQYAQGHQIGEALPVTAIIG
ncbi:EAL domain-containing protein [Brenneria goodwinii]|uniref:bifunctional diguanylate cyclase/phosphodiesterase n=1 Tax=Brenneria goodwinii TaxID=1109412 RepID=UPI000AA261D0|nr:bifunctional diguanylate cyclase/phosphodiesterase [Brenneria goodwinii]MCG8158819.1 EAL domain-containing protein [Brenneria goodwinii]MCG8163462.1 EAL domain-containing protein [Brenneria goodwinii]MCG8167948.1 EAL domain-containing protein [Brenneria goodwinii]MCG8172653.1 EAL domain-containing protein [Brenneria goodwinii]MCG8177314.1 EAL domain-containing protein [Brenneria goodwinii]